MSNYICSIILPQFFGINVSIKNTTLYSEKICTYLKNIDKDIIFYFLFFSVTSFLLYFWMKHTQKRIYKLVFETCYFSHQHEKIISQILPNESEKQISSNKKCAFTIVVESIRSFINRCCLRVCKKLRSFFDKLYNDNNTKKLAYSLVIRISEKTLTLFSNHWFY